MARSRTRGMFFAALVFGVIACIGLLYVIRLLWAWTVPDLFPGAVKQGLVADTISWFTAFKIGLVYALLTGAVAHMRRSKR